MECEKKIILACKSGFCAIRTNDIRNFTKSRINNDPKGEQNYKSPDLKCNVWGGVKKYLKSQRNFGMLFTIRKSTDEVKSCLKL